MMARRITAYRPTFDAVEQHAVGDRRVAVHAHPGESTEWLTWAPGDDDTGGDREFSASPKRSW
jgi:hypothetical protein